MFGIIKGKTLFLCLFFETIASNSILSAEAKTNPGNSPFSPILLDVTEQAGIDFVHLNGTTGEYLLPEIAGAGGALFDYDNDGDLDLYIVQGAELKSGKNFNDMKWRDNQHPGDRLYRNDISADGNHSIRFTDVTDESGITAMGYGMGVATGDFNNDGAIDLYVTNLGSNQLFRNNSDGTFTDVTKQSRTDDHRWSTSAAFVDYDRDGWLDLFVTNYVDFSISMKRECFAASSARDYCGPDAYDPIGDRLLHNRGDGTFQEVTEAAGMSSALGAGLGVVTADFDNDGWTDIYVANDGDLNRLWINKKGSGTFEDMALLAGVAVNQMGLAEASMGIDAADFDSDGDEDLFMTHLTQESNTFYLNLGDGFFEDRTIQFGLHTPSLRYTSFGTGFFDYDNDSELDLLVLNGAVRILEALAKKGDPYPLHQHNQLFRNNGLSGYVEVTKQAGSPFELSEVSRGSAFGDVDNDGDTDVVIFNNNGPTRLLLNQIGNQRYWLGLRVMSKDGKRDNVQARVEVLLGNDKVLWRRARTDGSYCSANDPRVLVGLGDDDKSQTVRIHWPDGEIEQYNNLSTNRYWIIQQGQAGIEKTE